jgi:hypothetical protein
VHPEGCTNGNPLQKVHPMSNSKRLIKTTFQLKICFCLLKLTELKRALNDNGWFYKIDVVNLCGGKYTTVDGYLQFLKKRGLLKYLVVVTKPDWQGGVLRLTDKGESEIKAELEESFSFQDINKALEKIQPIHK